MGKGIGSGRGRPKAPIKHGTYHAYNRRKCRCSDCYAAMLEKGDTYNKKFIIKEKNKLKDLPEHPLRKSKKLSE